MLSQLEGPRERLARLGPDSLSDEELIGLILTGGASGAVPARALLARVGGLATAARTAVEELRGPGIGTARAAALAAAFELARRIDRAAIGNRPVLQTARQAYAFLRPRMAHLNVEVFSVTLLDLRLRVLRELTVAEGSGWACAVHPRDVLGAAVRERAAAVLFAHNHPSGDVSPSAEDRALTARLVAACELLGLRPVDHLVVGRDGYSSFRELGLWP
jgi:DNA repair protein RadC